MPRRERPESELLRMLDLRAAGKSPRQIAALTRTSPGTVSGALHRIETDTGPPDEHDGTMPSGWWKAGLKRGSEREDGSR